MTQSESDKKKILLIEDEPIIGRLCRRILNAEGFEVDIADNGLVAKEITAAKDYAICISDIRLPGITGIQLYEQWKTSRNPIAEKLIFITGDTLNNNIQDFLEQSGRPYIMKPFAPEELVMAVREAIS
jgi:DNA-binding response OmpR family regulator